MGTFRDSLRLCMLYIAGILFDDVQSLEHAVDCIVSNCCLEEGFECFSMSSENLQRRQEPCIRWLSPQYERQSKINCCTEIPNR